MNKIQRISKLYRMKPVFITFFDKQKKQAIKKALAKRKKDLKAEDALRAKRKKEAEKAVAKQKPRGKSKARSGGTFGDAFRDIYDNQGPAGQFDDLDDDLTRYTYFRDDQVLFDPEEENPNAFFNSYFLTPKKKL